MSSNTMHFITGLPRSGSTLLGALMRQNPRFHASMSSPVASLFAGLLDQVSAGSEFSTVVTNEQRKRLLRGLFDSFYADKPEGSVVFDTNRMWAANMTAIADLYPQAKVIACVRNVAWIMDSIERLYRANPYENTRLFNDAVERNTVYSRVDTLGMRNRLVGYSWSALKEAFYCEQASALLIVEYDLLARAPEKVLPLVYQFIGEPWYEGHDFNHVEFDAPEFDNALGLSGLHKVRQQVAYVPRPSILPPDLFAQYENMSFWQDVANSRANVITTSEQPSGRTHPTTTTGNQLLTEPAV